MGLWFVNGHAVLRILGSGPGDHAECRPSHTYTHKTRFGLRVGRLSQDVWERFKCKLRAGCENTRVTKDQPAHLRGMKDRVCILLFSGGGCEPPPHSSSACLSQVLLQNGNSGTSRPKASVQIWQKCTRVAGRQAMICSVLRISVF